MVPFVGEVSDFAQRGIVNSREGRMNLMYRESSMKRREKLKLLRVKTWKIQCKNCEAAERTETLRRKGACEHMGQEVD